MGRYKEYSYEQILPGTFEHTLHNLIDKKIDLSFFYERGNNDEHQVVVWAEAF